METPDVPEGLSQFGPPVFVTDDQDWRFVAVERTGGEPDAVLVFSRNGTVQLRTEALSRPPDPRWLDIKNVQAASINRPDASPTVWASVEVADAQADVFLDGEAIHVNLLQSYRTPGVALTAETFRFTLEREGRRLTVAGVAAEFEGLRLRTWRHSESERFGGNGCR